MTSKKLIWIIVILSFVGIAIAVESLIGHYAPIEHEFCNINETFNCSAVNRGVYSTFLGVPVAMIGLAGYIFLLAMAVAYANRKNELILTLMGTAAIVGFGFTLYLNYLEAFVIHAWCVVCIGSAITMTLLFIAIMWLRKIELPPGTPTIEEIHE